MEAGRRLAAAFSREGLTTRVVAEKLQVADRTVGGWRRGERGPSEEHANQLGILLNEPELRAWWTWPSADLPDRGADSDGAARAGTDQDSEEEPHTTSTPSTNGSGPAASTALGHSRRLVWFVIGLAVVVVVAGVLFASNLGSRRPGASPPAIGTPSVSSMPSGRVRELADNRQGSPVYAAPDGTPVQQAGYARMPYGTEVWVRCFQPDQSGMATVTAFYLIDGGKWAGLWVVSDTMTNGGPLGNTTTPPVDAHVPHC